MISFTALSASHIYFGPGVVSGISEVIATLCNSGATIVLVTDKNIVATGMPDRIVSWLRDAGYRVVVLDSVPAEPTDHDLDMLAEKVRIAGASAIIAVGGGSVIDAAKILSVLAIHSIPTQGLVEKGVPAKGLPTLMIPTTAGTGAEATQNAIVLFPSKNLKIGIVSPYFIPDRIILDPELTIGLSPSLTASTGIDAVCHLLECFLGKKANAFSDMYALEGLRLMMSALSPAFRDGSDIEARSRTMLGAYYGGVCIAASGTNAVHALSYPLGGVFRIPHGVANAILLVPVMKYQKDRIAHRLAMAADAMGCRRTGNDAADASAVIERLSSLVVELNIPTSLERFGVDVSALDMLTDAAYGVRRLLDNNPIELTKNDIKAIYREVL